MRTIHSTHDVVVVGDAGYHRDAIGGLGISDAFRDAELLARALDRALRGDADAGAALRSYQRQRDALLREAYDVTRALSEYPQPSRSVMLHQQLAKAIDSEAAFLASLPELTVPAEVAA